MKNSEQKNIDFSQSNVQQLCAEIAQKLELVNREKAEDNAKATA